MNTSRFFTQWAMGRLFKNGDSITPETVKAEKNRLMKQPQAKRSAEILAKKARFHRHAQACAAAKVFKADPTFRYQREAINHLRKPMRLGGVRQIPV